MAEERAESTNPFTLPSDEEVFRMRDRERKQKLMDRQEKAKLKVWQKTTTTSTTGRSARLNDLIPQDDDEAEDSSKRTQKTRNLVRAAKNVLGQDRREKEHMTDFIAKKREMFLVQMSLDTKREEIRKLEEKAQMKEEALKKSEQMLEEDAIRFDTFLKENDKKAHEAIRKAERETKLKQDKVQEIKRLNQAIQQVQSDMSKHKEALEDCLKYKEFLDSLTPQEFVDDQARKKQERQEHRRQERIAKRLDEWESDCKRVEEEWKAKEDQAIDDLVKAGKSRKTAKIQGSLKGAPRLPSRPDVDKEPYDESGQEDEMYFTKPQQLLDIFTQLEEQNLFLIQNSQETEQQLEELIQEFNKTQDTMNSKTSELGSTIHTLRSQIGREEGRAEQLTKRIEASTGDTHERQGQLLLDLRDKVSEVYKACGFDAAGGSPETLFMLSELEAKLEDLLTAIEQMPEEFVRAKEKEKDKTRRDRRRLENQEEEERRQEARNKMFKERAEKPIQKKAGRQVMFRSAPIRRKLHEVKTDENKEDLDEIKHLT